MSELNFRPLQAQRGHREEAEATFKKAVDVAPKNPDASSIVQLLSLVSAAEETAAMRAAFAKGGTGYGDFKKQLFARLWEFFAPMRQRREEILAQPAYLDDVLAKGAERANVIANEVMERIRSAVGLR